MRLLTDNDTLTICADCGQPCRQREITAASGRQSRRVVFLTHAESLDEAEHSAVFARISAFYSKMFDLLEGLQCLSSDDCRLSYGRLVHLDLAAVMPTACARRTDIIPTADVRVAGIVKNITLPAMPIEGATVEGVLDALKIMASPVAASLNAQYEARDF